MLYFWAPSLRTKHEENDGWSGKLSPGYVDSCAQLVLMLSLSLFSPFFLPTFKFLTAGVSKILDVIFNHDFLYHILF